jgi:2-polyprenyl-3-methyl-5-hydroxy-6-metoxy-1,4-benzoquinol methylase
MQFRYRSAEKEYLDRDNILTKDLYRNLLELDIINKQLGGYRASLNGLKYILKTNNKFEKVLDIGFGGGDSIKQFSGFAEKNSFKLFFYGVDLKNDCLKYAEDNLVTVINKELICDDYRNISEELLKQIDIIHCSLFLHHLTDEEIISLFKFAKTHQCTILVNDLHRNWMAYCSIKFITAIFSKSYLVKNDASLSVKRGFKKSELTSLLQQSGFKNFSIKWSWAFRYIVIAHD